MPLLAGEAAAAGIAPGGEGGQWPRGPVVVASRDPDFLLLPIDVGGVYRSLDGGGNWNLSMNGWNARGANGFAIDPEDSNHVIGIGGNSMDWDPAWGPRSPHGIYLSDDRAGTWRQVLAFRPGLGGTVAFAPGSAADGQQRCLTAYYASYDLGLFRSDDGGNSWRAVNRFPAGTGTRSASRLPFAVHPESGRVYLGDAGGLWASDDRGATFRKIWSGGAVHGLSLIPSAPDTLLLSSTAGIFRSGDAGSAWTALAAKGISRSDGEPILDLTVCPADSGRMFCWVQGADWAWVRYMSHDGGTTFVPIRIERGGSGRDGGVNTVPGGFAVLPCNVRNGFFAWHPTDADIAYGLGGDWVTRSTDGGRTFHWWNNGYNGIMLGTSFNFSAHEPNTVFFAFQDYNGAFTTDGGRLWNYRDISGHGWGGHCYGGHAVDARTMWYGDAEGWGTPRRTRISTDGGTTWSLAKDPSGADCVWKGADVSFSDPRNRDVLFASQWRSGDRGLTWQPMDGCDGVFCATRSGKLLGKRGTSLVESDDGGRTWRLVADVPSGFADVAGDERRGRYYLASGDRLVKWEKGQFTTLETPRDQYGNTAVQTVAADPLEPAVIYIGGAKNLYASHATVCRSDDGGVTWRNLTTSDGPHEVSWIRVHPVTREAWLNGQCFGNWRIAPPARLNPAPAGSANASPAPTLAITNALPPSP